MSDTADRDDRVAGSAAADSVDWVGFADALPLTVWTAGADGVVDFANEQFRSYVGLDASTDRVDGWLDAIHPSDRERLRSAWDTAVRTGETYEVEARLRRVDRTWRWHLLMARPDRGPGGDVRRWYGVAVDRHDAIAAELERRRDAIRRETETRLLERLLAEPDLRIALRRIAVELADLEHASVAVFLVEDRRFRFLASSGTDELVGRFAALDASALDARDGAATVPFTIEVGPGVAAVPVTDVDGTPIAVLGLVADRAEVIRDRSMIDRFAQLVRIVVEREQRASALRGSQRLLSIAARLGRFGGFSVELPDGPVEWSDEVAAIYERPAGYRPTLREAREYILPDHRATVDAAFTTSVERGEPFDHIVEIETASGRRRWVRSVGEAEVRADGGPVRVSGALVDVTEQVDAERTVRESEERYRLLAEVTSDVIFDWDLREQRIWVGEGLDDILGPGVDVAAIEREPPSLLTFTHADDRERVAASFDMAIHGEAGLWACEYRIVRTDGRVVEVEGSGQVLHDDQGRPRRLLGAVVDLTAQRELERRIARSQHLESIGQLTGGIAHDFNNLLTVVIGNLDAIADDLTEEQRSTRQLVDIVRRAAQRGSELTRHLLAFARRQPLEPSVTDVVTLVEDVADFLRRTLGEHVHVHLRRTGPVSTAVVDAAQLEAALINVAINARDAMPDGGDLTFRLADVERAPLPDDVTDAHPAATGVRTARPLELVAIEVADTGHGMGDDVADRAFEPFFTTKEPGRGTGLGLSMVYGFVEQSGGMVELESAPGKGTVVRLLLPRADADDTAVLRRPVPSSRSVGSGRVLVVEDDELVRSMVSAQLQRLGYDVDLASNGAEAISRLERDGPYDLLFTDVVMPGGMNGGELADRARQVHPSLPVLFTSGYAEAALAHDGRGDDHIDLLSKPYRLEQLAERVSTAIARGR